MHQDHSFIIGSTHIVCEDYALSGQIDDIHYAIVSDGCSSSNNTDVGARILSHLAVNHIESLHHHDTFPKLIANLAENNLSSLALSNSALDATLLVAATIDDKLIVRMFGDGVVVIKKRNDPIKEIISAEYPSNYPYYISYLLNNKARKVYFEIFNKNFKYGEDQVFFSNKSVIYHHKDSNPWLYREYQKEDIEYVILFSDGIQSFINKNDLTPALYLNEAIEEFTSFKTFKGSFIQRRFNKAIKNYHKHNIVNVDDLSMAGIINES